MSENNKLKNNNKVNTDTKSGVREGSMEALPLARVYTLLEPGPVLLLGTVGRGRANLMALSWHTMMEFEPPWVGCVVDARNYSYELLRASRECVLNVPGAELAAAVVGCGNISGRRVDKYRRFGLTAAPSALVLVPRVAECFASLECRLRDTRMAHRYNLLVLEVVRAWIRPAAGPPRTLHHRGHGRFMIAGEEVVLSSRRA